MFYMHSLSEREDREERRMLLLVLLAQGGKPWEGLQAAYECSVMSTWS